MELWSGLAAQTLVSSVEVSSLIGLDLLQSLHQSSLLKHTVCSWEIEAVLLALLVLEKSLLTSLYLSFLICKIGIISVWWGSCTTSVLAHVAAVIVSEFGTSMMGVL